MARILVIEDEASIRSNLVRFIGLEGHEAIEATNGRSGLQAAQAVTPDLIFCDGCMVFMTGGEVLAAIQLDATLRQVPFIFLSASAEPERLEEALRLGADGYVTKPFNFSQLRALMLQHLPESGDGT